MTDTASLRGACIQQMAGTISFKNWPFLVLLAIIGLLTGLVVGGPGGVLVGIGVPGVPAGMVALAGYAANLVLVRPIALYEHGWEVSVRARKAFWPWESLELESDQIVETGGISNHALTLAHSSTRLRLVLQSGVHGPPAVEATLAHLKARASEEPSVNLLPEVKPLPKWGQHVILVVVLGLFAGLVWLVRPSTKRCTVKESHRSSDTCILSGTVKSIDAHNKELNAKAMGSTELDEVILEDSTGSRSIYFDPTKLSLNGRISARVTGREVEERGSGVRRFVAKSVE